MILNRFFKPKWQHPDPQIRAQAVQDLDASDPVLTELAREDEHAAVRRAALHRLADLTLLWHIALEDREAGVREAAEARFRKLMAGKEPDSPVLKTRMSLLSASLPPAVVSFLASHGAEPQLRLAALEGVQDQHLLARIAAGDAAGEVRRIALERIHDLSLLEHVAKQVRNRDKRLSRRAQERLQSLRSAQQQADQAAALCAELESLIDETGSEPDIGRLHGIEKRWESVASAANTELQERYRDARLRFQERLEARAARRVARRDLCESLQRFLQRLDAEEELSAELAEPTHETLAQARTRWSQEAPDRSEERRFAELIQAIEDRERILRRDHERAERLRAILQDADALLHQTSEVRQKEIAGLGQRWKSLERPQTERLRVRLQAEFEAALDRLRARLQRQAEQKDQELAEIEQSIEDMKEALAQGRLQRAISLRDRAHQRLKQNIGLSRQQMAMLERRLHGCMPQMDELRDWRRWGTNQAREGLCAEAESLLDIAPDPASIAKQVKRLRAHWKTLDSATGPAPRALWNRFNDACERAYEPCRAHFEVLAKERQENLRHKQALCERLEQFEATTDWTQVDWHAADQLWHEAQNQWRKIGPVNRADRKELEQRYKQVLRRLDTRLDEERRRELHRREELIRRVQHLAEGDDLQTAIDGAKQAQTEWHPTVLASRRQEQALWQAFRTACDAVFERRQTERQAIDRQRQTNLDRKNALCEEIEKQAQNRVEPLPEASTRLREIEEEWQTIGPVPKSVHKKIEHRFAKACQALRRHHREARLRQARQEIQNLREHACLCARIESLSSETEPSAPIEAEIAQARQDWEALPPLPETWVEPLRQRFETACRAATEDAETRQKLLLILQENLETKKSLCLRLEILAGVDSPPEFAQARMEHQVARLSESLSTREAPPSEQKKLDEAREVEQGWYLTAALPGELNEALEARFDRALAALHETAA